MRQKRSWRTIVHRLSCRRLQGDALSENGWRTIIFSRAGIEDFVCYPPIGGWCMHKGAAWASEGRLRTQRTDGLLNK